MLYHIPSTNYPKLESEVEKLNVKANKLGFEPLELKIIEEINVVKQHSSLGFKHNETIYVCSIVGEPPRLEGWTLVARIEPQKQTDEDTGENIIREVPGQECPVEYRATDMHCDHCGVNVRRNHVWVLTDGNEYRQVGGSCFKDFFGGVNPDVLLRRAESSVKFTDLVKEAQLEKWGSKGNKPIDVIPIESFVTVVALLTRQIGFMPKSKATDDHPSTASLAWDICLHDGAFHVQELIKKKELVCQESDVENANAAIEWAKQLDPMTESNTYLHDLGVSCRQPYVTYRRSGYVASVIAAYERSEEKPVQVVAKKESSHIGKEKERLVFTSLKIEKTGVYDSQFGLKTWVRFVDDNGNVLTWRTSGTSDSKDSTIAWIEEDKTVDVKATIGKHTEFNGEKQTELKRVVLETL